MSIVDSLARIARWLEVHAPRVLELLLPAETDASLDAFASEFECAFPPDLAALYRVHGGQDPAAKVGLFRGYYFMPLRGVDGLETEWDRMVQKADAGARGASKELYPFAKDFGGNFLCLDRENAGRIVELEEGEIHVLAPSMDAFLSSLATDLEKGRSRIEYEEEEVLETAEVVFDAARARKPGDKVVHSVFERLGIDARVESLESVFLFEEREKCGFAVRLHWIGDDLRVDTDKLVDASGRRPGSCGRGSGGGVPGMYIFARAQRPLPDGSRLHVKVERVRTVTVRAPRRKLSARLYVVASKTEAGWRARCPSLSAIEVAPSLAGAVEAAAERAKLEILEGAARGRVVNVAPLDKNRFTLHRAKLDQSSIDKVVFEYAVSKADPAGAGPAALELVATWLPRP